MKIMTNRLGWFRFLPLFGETAGWPIETAGAAWRRGEGPDRVLAGFGAACGLPVIMHLTAAVGSL
jgi:hypothetical protein